MPQMLLSSFSAKDGILPEDLFRQAHLPSGCKKYLFTYRGILRGWQSLVSQSVSHISPNGVAPTSVRSKLSYRWRLISKDHCTVTFSVCILIILLRCRSSIFRRRVIKKGLELNRFLPSLFLSPLPPLFSNPASSRALEMESRQICVRRRCRDFR